MFRRPPRSTLFPSRRSSDLVPSSFRIARELLSRLEDERTGEIIPRDFHVEIPRERVARSEEHTSELQSHSDLVCRLLLEKKKKNVHDLVQPDVLLILIHGGI